MVFFGRKCLNFCHEQAYRLKKITLKHIICVWTSKSSIQVKYVSFSFQLFTPRKKKFLRWIFCFYFRTQENFLMSNTIETLGKSVFTSELEYWLCGVQNTLLNLISRERVAKLI